MLWIFIINKYVLLSYIVDLRSFLNEGLLYKILALISKMERAIKQKN